MVKGWVVPSGLAVILAGAAVAMAAEPLRYGPKAGQQAVYEVNIEATLPDSVETRTGHITYDCKSVDAGTGQVTFSCSSQLQSKSTPKQNNAAGPNRGPGRIGPPPGMMGPPRGFGGPGMIAGMGSEVVVGPYGQVVSSSRLSDGAQLPFMLGYDWNLVIEPLSPDNQKNWRSEKEIAVTSKQNSWPPLPPFAADQKTARSAREVCTYTLTADAGDNVTISKTYDLNVPQGPGGGRGIQQSGQGQFIFGREAGLITSLDMNYTIRVADSSVTVTVPVKVKARLLSSEEAAKAAADQKAAAETAKANALAAMEPKTATAAEVDAVLRELKSSRQPAWAAYQKLSQMAMLPERQKAVIAALTTVLKTKDAGQPGASAVFDRQHAIRALGVWGTAKEVRLLAPFAASDGDVFAQMAAMEALGKMGTPEAAEAIAAGFHIRQGRPNAIKALESIGAPAEPAVIALLKDRGADVRSDACRVLEKIGTKKSIKPLEDMVSRETGISAGKARADQAIKAIEQRQP